MTATALQTDTERADVTAVAGHVERRVRFHPVTQRAAMAWVNATHRHLDAPVGDLFRVGLYVGVEMVAVGLAGRPARMLQDGTTAELTRIASTADVETNACSRLYGALRRAGLALGYRRFVTYTLEHEPGTSLRAAGFHDDGLTDGGEWTRPSRPRKAAQQPGRKRRWIWPGRDSGLWDAVKPNVELSRPWRQDGLTARRKMSAAARRAGKTACRSGSARAPG